MIQGLKRYFVRSILTVAAFIVCGVSSVQAAEFWANTSTTKAPSARFEHTAVWTGSQMLIWGGYDPDVTNTGGVYTLSENSWATLTTSAAIGARWGHTAVWSGTEMLIWGGGDNDYFGRGLLNNGGRYTPSSGWILISDTGANVPSARSNHTAVWDTSNSKMIVWGGWGTDGNLNSGGKFDPATQTWSATSLTSAPSARHNHTAVWTGSKMVIWGGDDGTSSGTTTGGIYDPSTDTWTPTSLVDAPAARTHFTSTWTGSKMLVWGGWKINGGNVLQDGGIFDPVTNTWSPITTVGAPVGRYEHSAVWNGTEMVVWGGEVTSGHDTSTGGAYNVSTMAWSATPVTGAPSARARHMAVWTDSGMIVWGGDNVTSTTALEATASSSASTANLLDSGGIVGDSVVVGDFSGAFAPATWGSGENPTGKNLLAWTGQESVALKSYKKWATSGVAVSHTMPFDAKLTFSWTYDWENYRYRYIAPGCPASYSVNGKIYLLTNNQNPKQGGSTSIDLNKGDTVAFSLNGTDVSGEGHCYVRNPSQTIEVVFKIFDFMVTKR